MLQRTGIQQCRQRTYRREWVSNKEEFHCPVQGSLTFNVPCRRSYCGWLECLVPFYLGYPVTNVISSRIGRPRGLSPVQRMQHWTRCARLLLRKHFLFIHRSQSCSIQLEQLQLSQDLRLHACVEVLPDLPHCGNTVAYYLACPRPSLSICTRKESCTLGKVGSWIPHLPCL